MLKEFGRHRYQIRMGEGFIQDCFAVQYDSNSRVYEFQILDANGIIRDTSGLSLQLVVAVGSKGVFANGSVLNAKEGLFEVILNSDQLSEYGKHEAQVKISDSTGTLQSPIFKIDIGKSIFTGAATGTNIVIDYKKIEDARKVVEGWIENPEQFNGKDGADGENGVDGRDGVDGKNGADGKDGKSFNIKDVLTSVEELEELKETAMIGDSYLINGHIYVFSENTKDFKDGGTYKGDKGDKGDKGIQGIQGPKGERGEQGIQGIQGPKGDQGIQGPQGEKGDVGKDLDIIDVFESIEQLPTNLNDDNFGDCYIVGKELYIWSSTGWLNYGELSGPAGKSAYEIAKENGFEGTESEWLESLKGESGGGSNGVVNQVAFEGTDQKISFVNPDKPESRIAFNATFEPDGLGGSKLAIKPDYRVVIGGTTASDEIFKINVNNLNATGDTKLSRISSSSQPFSIQCSSTMKFQFGSWYDDPTLEFNKSSKLITVNPINGEGQIGSPSSPFTNGYFKNSINVTSDRNKKENIQYLEDKDSKLTLKDCYDYIKNVYKPATYNLIDSSSSNKKIGIIAQDSESSNVGDLIVEKIDDNYTLNEYAHSSAIGAALKQAILEIENLKLEIEKLKAK